MAENPRSKFWTISPGEGVDLAVESEGIAAEKPVTIGQLFQQTCQIFPNRPALRYKEGDTWIPVSFTQYYANCFNTAKSFIKLGLEKYKGVAILGFNAPEWFYSNIGAMFAGGLSVGVYATNGPEACQFVASDCKANIIVVENQKQLDKILQIRDQLPELKAIVQYHGKLSQEYEMVYDWEQFIELGKDIEDKQVEDLICQQKPEECCLLVYTSGTTGTPKAVMLSHDNLTWTSKALFEHLVVPTKWHSGDPADTISYLPLSHIAGQVADIYLPLVAGCTVNFAQPDALKGSLVNTLKEVKPTMFFGVPRVWEKMMEGMQAKAVNVKGLKKRLGAWAVAKGFEGNDNIQNKQPYPWGWTVAGFILNKIKQQLGLEAARLLSVGAAPMQRAVVEFFMGYDMPVLELYGMSENTGPTTTNTITDWKLNTVGKAICGTKIKLHNLDENGEGEVCMYGRHVFMGYLDNEEKTKEVIDDDGWLHSGDFGKIDQDGFLSITGRLKELIITSGGENVAPVPIESRIKAAVPFLSNVMVIGDKQKYLSCLVTLKCVMNLDTGEPTDEVHPSAVPHLLEAKCELTKPSEIAELKPEGVMKKIQDGLDMANEHSVSRAQKIQKFTLLSIDFSMPGNELGPTLKLKRRVVVDKYSAAIEALYSE